MFLFTLFEVWYHSVFIKKLHILNYIILGKDIISVGNHHFGNLFTKAFRNLMHLLKLDWSYPKNSCIRTKDMTSISDNVIPSSILRDLDSPTNIVAQEYLHIPTLIFTE